MVRYVRIRRLRDISTTLSMATHEPVCTETPQSASAGRPQLLLLQRLRAAPGPPRACQCYRAPPQDTTLLHRAKFPTLACAATGRGGPADRPTPKAPPVASAHTADRPTPPGGADATRRRRLNAAHTPTRARVPREPHAPRGPRRLTRRAPSQPSHKTFRTKRTLAKKMAQNRPIPQWIRMRTGNKIRWNSKRRHWRRTKLGL